MVGVHHAKQQSAQNFPVASIQKELNTKGNQIDSPAPSNRRESRRRCRGGNLPVEICERKNRTVKHDSRGFLSLTSSLVRLCPLAWGSGAVMAAGAEVRFPPIECRAVCSGSV
ncbi:hypothetical protein AAFF_G00035720 [Aldrovandia affinis]|uniref:Uncharacterized protein n=1 Tax=Aldrovandia affinis TaxID=143900 RepID=A0AAD7S357_9TELE|nr:hypothetical protein AAFF_G00035720 [Aldrovandia affinis]